MVLFWATLMLPLSFVDKMSSLQCTSLFGIVALCFLVLAVTVHFLVDVGLNSGKVLNGR
jgi:amino acid permease